MTPTEWPKRCTCCGREYTKAQWAKLRYVGIQADDVQAIEMRDCKCKSTLAVLKDEENNNETI